MRIPLKVVDNDIGNRVPTNVEDRSFQHLNNTTKEKYDIKSDF